MTEISVLKVSLCIAALISIIQADAQPGLNNNLRPVALASITIKGELATRLEKNFDRVENLYKPDYIFKSQNAKTWPGDAEGRAILALVIDARATKRAPKYLDEIIAAIPQHLNKQGYF